MPPNIIEHNVTNNICLIQLVNENYNHAIKNKLTMKDSCVDSVSSYYIFVCITVLKKIIHTCIMYLLRFHIMKGQVNIQSINIE